MKCIALPVCGGGGGKVFSEISAKHLFKQILRGSVPTKTEVSGWDPFSSSFCVKIGKRGRDQYKAEHTLLNCLKCPH